MPRRTHHRSRSIHPPQWHNPMVDMLIEERQKRNEQYHTMYGRNRQGFWESVSRRFVYMIFYTFFKKKIQIQIIYYVNSE